MALRAFTLFCFSPQAMLCKSCCFRGPLLLWCCAHVHVWTSTLFLGGGEVERCQFWYDWFPLCSLGDGPFHVFHSMSLRLVTGLTRPDTRSEDRAFLDQIEQKMKVRRRRTTGRPDDSRPWRRRGAMEAVWGSTGRCAIEAFGG